MNDVVLAQRVAYFYQDRMARRVAARFLFSASLLDELTTKMDMLFASFDKDEAVKLADWFKATFRFDGAKTPQGQKDLKSKAAKFHGTLREGSAAAGALWEQDLKPLAGDLIRYFSDEGGKIVPREIQAGGNTYLNLVGLDQKKIGHYVTSMEAVFDQVKGWRRKALGGLRVALAGSDEPAAGVYKSAEDTLYVRATPQVLKRSHGTYGDLDYTLIRELGRRFAVKNSTEHDFDHPDWWTTSYSQNKGSAFAELFALSNFGVTGDWDPERIKRFDALMGS